MCAQMRLHLCCSGACIGEGPVIQRVLHAAQLVLYLEQQAAVTGMHNVGEAEPAAAALFHTQKQC